MPSKMFHGSRVLSEQWKGVKQWKGVRSNGKVSGVIVCWLKQWKGVRSHCLLVDGLVAVHAGEEWDNQWWDNQWRT